MSTLDKVTFTPELAQQIINDCFYELGRPIRIEQVDRLALEMGKGNFLTNTIELCQNGIGKRWLINGNHTLRAIVKSGVTLELPRQIFPVMDYSEVASYYARTDRGVGRTRLDTLRAYEMTDKMGMSRADLEHYAAASVLVLCDFETRGRRGYMLPDNDILQFMTDWLDHAKCYLSNLADSPIRREMSSRAPMSIGLVTTKYNQTTAGAFWRQCAMDDGLELGDPRKTLNRWFQETGMQGGAAAKRKRIVDVPEALRSIATAWNYWQDQRPLKIIKVVNKSLPIVIRNTPYNYRGKKLAEFV